MDAQVIFFNKTRAVGVLHGSPDAPLNKLTRDLGTAAESFTARWSDIRASAPRLLRSEQDRMAHDARAQLARAVETAAQQIKTQRDELRSKMREVSALPAAREVSYYTALVDQELRNAWRTMAPALRAGQLHQMLADPGHLAAQLPMVEALLRAPVEVTGLKYDEHRALHVRHFAALRPDLFKGLDTERLQAETARNALTLTTTLVTEATGERAPFAMAAPTVAALTGDAPLEWWPAEITERYNLR